MTPPHPTHPYWSHIHLTRNAQLCIFSRHQDGNPNTGGSAALGGKIGGGWGLTVDPRVTIWTALDDSAQSSTLPVSPRTLSSDDLGPISKPAADPGVSEGGVVINW